LAEGKRLQGRLERGWWWQRREEKIRRRGGGEKKKWKQGKRLIFFKLWLLISPLSGYEIHPSL
jgi:hypothetical protein